MNNFGLPNKLSNKTNKNVHGGHKICLISYPYILYETEKIIIFLKVFSTVLTFFGSYSSILRIN